jgi:undecaprenyl pyrophosphate phosphatase UppP
MKASKVRVGLEAAVALLAGCLSVVTIFWHDWIEALTGWDPDQHSGSAEWLIVVGLLIVAVAVGTAARRHWRQLLTDPE